MNSVQCTCIWGKENGGQTKETPKLLQGEKQPELGRKTRYCHNTRSAVETLL